MIVNGLAAGSTPRMKNTMVCSLFAHGVYGTGKFSVSEPSELNGLPGDKMLVMPEAFRHYGMGYKMPREINNTGKTLVVQYEVRLTKGLDCGGAYLKLLSASPELDLSNLDNDTPYSIMFGPDKCGHDSKVCAFQLEFRSHVFLGSFYFPPQEPTYGRD